MLPRSDEALYQRLLEGELDAFDQLYERYERHVFGFVCRQLGDPAEAEDVMHEAFLALLREREKGRAARSFRAFLFQIVRNLCLNGVRSRQRTARAMDGAAQVLWGGEREGAGHPEHALAEQQTRAALSAAVGRLPAPLIELYQLRASGLSYEELTEVLGIPLGTVKSRMHELLNRLREEMRS
jgi:RNA polymerase sigma-70 factor, ECF subfamily